jgi:predicted component of type VI protein secretion system
MASQTFQLVMHSGPTPGKIFELVQDEVTIGRDIGNRIVINDPEVSRKHARLTLQTGGFVIEDLGSTNGTFINGQRLIGPHMLRPGETIMFGEKISLEYEILGFDPNATLVGGTSAQAAPPPSRETYRVETPDFGYPPAAPPGPPVQQPDYYQPPAVPVYQSPPPAYSPAAPVFSGQVPPGPSEPYVTPAGTYDSLPPEEEPARSSSRTWLIAGCGCLVIILVCVVVGLAAYYFDSQNLYCTAPFDALFACP